MFARFKSVATVATVIFALLGAAIASSSATAAALSPTVSTTGTLYTGSNAAAVAFRFTAQTNIPSGGGLYFNSEGLDIPGCQTLAATCTDVNVSASTSNLTGSTVTTKYVYGGSYYQFVVALSSAVSAGETISINFPVSKLNIGTTSAWFETATYSTPVNTGQIMLNRLDVSAHVNVGAVNPPATVTFDADGGLGTMAAQTASTTTALTPNSFTKAGYVFSNWYDASAPWMTYNDGANYSFASNVTLKASWTAAYTVTFNSNFGTATTTTQTAASSRALSSNSFSRSGYAFSGWATSPSGSVAYADGATYAFSSSTTLYALWTATSRTVTFDANGGAGTIASQSSGSAANLTANAFSRNGYYFDGWNTAANGTGTNFANSANYDFVANATMYAKWRAIPLAPSGTVSIQVPVGQPIANAPVALQADGLKDQTGYTVTVHSTPQIIDQGTIWSGRLNTTVRIPANLESGWHRLVIEGTAADGTPWTETSYFKVTASGLLDATSDVIPAELAFTSAPDASGTITLSVLLLGAGVLLTAAGYRLRRRSVNAE